MKTRFFIPNRERGHRYEANLIKAPSGKFIFVGSVPLPLAFKDAEMTKTRVYDTVQEAQDHAKELRFVDYKIAV